MIKKVNMFLAVAFAAMLAMKGMKEIKDARARKPQRQEAGVEQRQDVSQLAPCVCYGHWTGYTLENPISNRNGILLDTIRAIFPKATFRRVRGGMDEFIKMLREEENVLVVGFGSHPALKDFPVAPTPLMHCPLVLLTLRTNPWTYRGFSSLTELRILSDEANLDYKVMRDLRNKVGKDSKRLRFLPTTVSKVEMAEIVEKGEADAFVISDMKQSDVYALAGLTSMRIFHNFRKSKPIANDGTLLYASEKDADFAKRAIEEYEKGMRRIDSDGQRRRIFEYYGIPYETLPAK